MKTLKKMLVLTSILASSFSSTAAEKKFYNGGSQAEAWVNSHSDAPEAKLIKEKIASQPQFMWLGKRIGTGFTGEVDMAKDHKEILPIVTYNIPNRDLGHYSAGGASESKEYLDWVTTIANTVGDAEVVCVVEPDAIGHAPKMPSALQLERYSMLSNSVKILKQNKSTKVFLAISGWLGVDGAVDGLKKSGIDNAYGFAYNISGYNDMAKCFSFCDEVSKRLGGKPYILDTSRNGNGSWKPDNEADKKEAWCNPPGRALGPKPTFETGHPGCYAFAWVKRPGESDGTNRGPKAGEFSPKLAYELAKNAKW